MDMIAISFYFIHCIMITSRCMGACQDYGIKEFEFRDLEFREDGSFEYRYSKCNSMNEI